MFGERVDELFSTDTLYTKILSDEPIEAILKWF